MNVQLLHNHLWLRTCRTVWIVSLALVVYLCLTPSLKQPLDVPGMDKVYHGLTYSWLALLPQLAFARPGRAAIASGAMIGLGVLLELGQAFVPGRFCSGLDIAANSLGVGLGLWLGLRLRSALAA